MIIPIGHEQSTVRRLPYVTFGIIGLCVLVNLLMPSEALYELAEPPWQIEDAADYWRDHAYLEVDDLVRDEVALDVGPGDREAYLAELRDHSIEWAPESIDERQDEQDQLDRMTRTATGQASDNPYVIWGLVPGDPSFLSLLTHLFIHAGWLHLLGNLFLLFIAAPAVEDRWGRPLFAGFYVAAGVLAAAFFSLVTPDRAVPLVGASGAISGVLGAFLVLFARSQIRFAYFFLIGLRPYRGTFEAPAWLILPLWIGNEMLQGWLAHSMGFSDGVAYWAHVGGFVAGAGMAFGIVRSGVEEKYIHAAIESKVTLSSIHPDAERALDLREQGQLDEAIVLLQGALADAPKDLDLCLAYWDSAAAAGRAPEAVDAVKCLIRERAVEKELSQAAEYWLELADKVPEALVDPDTLLRIAPALVALERPQPAQQALRQALDSRQPRLTAGTALRIADQARGIDPPTTLRALELAMQLGDFPDAKLERLQEQARALREQGVESAKDWDGEASLPPPREPVPDTPSWQSQDAIEIEPEEDLSRPPSEASRRHQPPPLPLALELSEDGGLDALELPADLVPPPVPGAAPDLTPPPLPQDTASTMLDADALDPAAFEEAVPGEPNAGSEPDSVFGALASEDDSYELGDPNVELAVTPSSSPLLSTPPPEPLEVEAESASPPGLEARGDDWWELDDEPDAASDADAVEGSPIASEEEAVSASLSDDSFADLVDSLADLPRFSNAKVIEARPTALTDDTLRMLLTDGRKTKLEYAKLEGVAVGAVAGLATQPVVLIDLLLNWNEADAEQLRIIRLRSDGFDPRSLAAGVDDPTSALQQFLAGLLDGSGATPVPDHASATGDPFGRYEDLEQYEREVLKLDV